jgi:hypothetical protein
VSERGFRLSPLAFFAASALAVVVVAGLAALATWLFHAHTKPPCTLNCPPPRVKAPAGARAGARAGAPAGAAALPEAETYTSRSLGWTLSYPEAWKVADTSGDKVLFQTRAGLLKVVAVRGKQDATELIDQELSAINRSEFPDLTHVGVIHGAHIGRQEGDGQLYQATFYPPSGGGSGLLVRIGIIVASDGDATVVCTALAPYEHATGRMLAEDIDYALTEFRWRGGA